MTRKIILPQKMEEIEEYIEQEMRENPQRISVYIHEKTVWKIECYSEKSVKEHVESLGYTTVRPWIEHGDAVIVYPKGYNRPETGGDFSFVFFLMFMVFIVLIFLSFL